MKKSILIIFFSLIFLPSGATHNRGGEILYQRVAPFYSVVGTSTVDIYKFRITVNRYHDFGANVAERCVDTVYFGDGAKSFANRSNGPVSPICYCNNSVPCGSIIINDPNYMVKKSVYTFEHIYPGPGNYLISSTDVNRNAGIINIPNSVNQPSRLESLLIISSITGTNSSPVFANPPLGRGGLANCFSYNSGAFDADGDSLSYDMAPSLGFSGQPVAGFTFPDHGVGGHFIVEHWTGFLRWCVPQSQGEYNFMIVVKEWRKNSAGVYQQIGSVLRDMQVIILSNYTGVNEYTQSGEFINVSPNPFINKLEIIFNKQPEAAVLVQLYTIEGKLLINNELRPVEGKLTLATETLPAGIYNLSMKDGSEVIHKKIVRQ